MPRLTVYSGVGEGSVSAWSHIRDLELADPECLSRDPVELLLGADAYASIALPDIRRGGTLEPIAQRTRLGWILLGSAGVQRAALTVSSLQCSAVDDLSAIVRRFWEWEEPPVPDVPLSAEDRKCEEHFRQTHQRLLCGRYQVRLSLREPMPDLSSTRRAAIRALENAERRFARDPAYHEQYKDFMVEYRALDHMSVADAVPLASAIRVAYLPHHGVLKGTGPNSKIRVVFNGSSRTASGASLNAAQLTGPNLLPPLADVVTRWRRHRFAFVTDIAKMYRQIRVHPEDRDLQRILWNERGQLVELHLNTVTYGLASAPYLAMRTLRQLASEESSRYPLGASVLERDIYMDDVLAGAATLEDCRRLREQVESLCTAGGFPLRKWAANHAAVLAGVANEHRLLSNGDATLPADDHAVLGLRWSPGSDEFAPAVRRTAAADTLTRRVLLSRTARLFDPLGWLAPVVVRAKLLIQSAWLLRLDWDAPLPSEETDAWNELEEGLPLLEAIRIPRWLQTDAKESRIELHGFADASERAYAAVIYARTVTAGETRVALVMAKTKVAPLKRISLPRLELCAASLLTKLAVHIRASLELQESPLVLWTDSTVVLGWIRGHPARWTTFVANRVAEIQRAASEAIWRHVPGSTNPADCASRGVSPRDLVAHPLWWRGPKFLYSADAEWPTDPGPSIPRDLPERRPARCLVATDPKEPDELCRFSSLRRLLRVTAWMTRWLAARSSRDGGRVQRGAYLEAEELAGALTRWLRAAQAIAFRPELEDIRAGRALSSRSSLRKLTPIIDGEGVLRVGGRLKHSLLSADQRHPIVIPEESHLTGLIIDASHRRTLHGGGQATLSDVRQRFWIPRGRQLVRRFIHRCPTCVRWRAASPQPMMGNLPRARVVPERPFLSTGVDFAGPIMLRTSKGRGTKAYKAFLAVFVCFVSRAVHLEVVSDYTAVAFLAAFRRFVSRRGPCRDIYSDCGTNFVGADRELRELFSAASQDCHKILGHLTDEGVQWHFNPPAAPHFGGLWEAAVKSVKHHLRRVIGETRLTYEEMATFLAEVEACLNSRPLQPLSDDPEDLEALTPGHFLVGTPLKSVPEPTLLDVARNRLSRWQLLQAMRDHLWQRWSQEYIQGLNPRPKWWKTQGNLREGQLCLIKDETTPPSRWPLARIVRLHPGDDGQVRVVDVRTVAGERKRPVVKIVPLPSEES